MDIEEKRFHKCSICSKLEYSPLMDNEALIQVELRWHNIKINKVLMEVCDDCYKKIFN